MNQYDYEAECRSFTVNGDLVNIHVTFNLELDWEDDCIAGQYVERKVFTVERGHISARLIEKSRMYSPTEEDLKEWESDIKHAISEKIRRRIAA